MKSLHGSGKDFFIELCPKVQINMEKSKSGRTFFGGRTYTLYICGGGCKQISCYMNVQVELFVSIMLKKFVFLDECPYLCS